MPELKLSNSKRCALVDAKDFARLASFTWRVTKLKRRATQYVVRDVRVGEKVVKVLLHREILQVPSSVQIDHKNRDGLDNRRKNLRTAVGNQNHGNTVGRAGRVSRYKGVSWDTEKRKWRAGIAKTWLGRYSSQKEAARAYNKAARARFGEFARLNPV